MWVAGAAVAAAAATAIVVWALVRPRPGDPVPVLIVEGVTVAVSGDRDAIVIDTSEEVPGTFQRSGERFRSGFGVGDATMIGSSVAPDDCLPPNSSGQRVRIGVVNAEADVGPGGAVVVWYECLGLAGEAP